MFHALNRVKTKKENKKKKKKMVKVTDKV